MASNSKNSILGDPRKDRIVLYVLYGVCALSVIADFFIHRHIDHPWEALPAFYSVYAFISIVVLIFLAKGLRMIVMRKEDYYDE